MRIILLSLLPLVVFAQDLQTLITAVENSNQMLKSTKLNTDASAKNIESQKSNSYPTLDIGTAYTTIDKVSAFEAGNHLRVYAKAGIDIFDGFKNRNLVKQKKREYQANQHDLYYYKETLLLDVIQDYFNIKSAEASLSALQKKSKQLQADLKRITRFKAAELATQDEIDKLQSTYDANLYDIETQKLNIQTLKEYLSLKTDLHIDNLKESHLIMPQTLTYHPSNALLALQKQAEALGAAAKARNAIYYPNLRLEDTYAYNDYSRDDGSSAIGLERIDKQNTLSLSANMRLFDNGTIKKQKQAIQIQKQALLEQINYKKKEEQVAFNLALVSLKSTQTNIKSTKSAYKAAQSTFKSIKAKFNAGIVDNVTYLDALTQMTNTNALYQKSLNDLEIAKANYYFRAGKNLKDFIQ
ncbi:MAG: TolC family protein [Epsilonproteobacteria bacterium]|nr:TolC family protein [Campylobacterota bacterium]